MNICQLTIFCMLINGMFNIERVDSVNKKLQKSFVEIFGEGWDEEERREEIGKVVGDWQNDDKQIGKETTTIGDQMQQQQERPLSPSGKTDQDDHKKGIEQIDNNDQRETMTTIGDQTRPSSGKIDQYDHKKGMEADQLSETQKREIIRKWHAIKEEIKQRNGKQSTEEWHKFDILLAKKLGRSRTTIYKWIRELGVKQRRSNEKKLAIIKKYWEMKRNNPKNGNRKIAKALKISRESIRKWKGKFREELGIYKWIKELGMNQIKMRTDDEKLALMRKYWEMKRKDPKIGDAKIAKELKVCRDSIQRWKRQFRELGMEMKRQLTEEQKREIVGAFKAIKERIKQRKCKPFSCKEWCEIEKLLAEKLGTNRDNIYKWNKQFGMGQRKMRTDEEKLAIVEQFCGMERNNPKISARKIAKALNIDRACIRTWKCQFGMR